MGWQHKQFDIVLHAMFDEIAGHMASMSIADKHPRCKGGGQRERGSTGMTYGEEEEREMV